MKLYDKVFPPKTITLANGKQIKKPRSRMPLVVLVLLAMTVISVRVTGFNMTVLVTRIREFFVILDEMIPPEWSYMPQIWQPLFDTIKMSLLGSFIGSVLVVPFAMLASTNIIHNKIVVSAVRLLLSIIRTLPTGVRAHSDLCIRPRNSRGHDGHSRFHLRLHRQDTLRGDRDGGYGSF